MLVGMCCVQIVDEREARLLEEYTRLIPIRLKDILDRYCSSQESATREIECLEDVLRDYRGPLSKIFQYYWCVSRASTCCVLTLACFV